MVPRDRRDFRPPLAYFAPKPKTIPETFPETRNPEPWAKPLAKRETPNPEPGTLNPNTESQDQTPIIWTSNPSLLNPKPVGWPKAPRTATPSPEPQTLARNPEPETLTPTPEILNPKPFPGSRTHKSE